jgi:hypothetical protein
MAASRSYYLNSRQDDFAESHAETGAVNINDIPYVTPANDDSRTKDRLSTRCGILIRRLIALHSLRRPREIFLSLRHWNC